MEHLYSTFVTLYYPVNRSHIEDIAMLLGFSKKLLDRGVISDVDVTGFYLYASIAILMSVIENAHLVYAHTHLKQI